MNVHQQISKDLSSYKTDVNIGQCMKWANTELGKSYVSQLRELMSLSRGLGQITPEDYCYFNLYDDSRYDMAEKRRFLSERIHQGIILKCCALPWWGAADDKALAHTILESCGAPLPTNQAIYSTSDRNFGQLPCFGTIEGLEAFLADQARFPLFAKPIGGIASFGAFRVDGYDAPAKHVILAGGDTITSEAFIRQIDHEDGYLLQDILRPHPRLREVCGDMVSTVRVIIIIDQGRPEIIQTVWKIPASGNIADNFWRSGNMLAAVGRDTGVVERVVRGVGPDQEELDDHPDTGQPLKGFQLPDWDQALALCLEFAMAFHKLRYQSWDIALCPDGPVFVEVNTGSAFNLSQLATAKGFLTDRFRGFLESCGYGNKKRK